MQGNWTVAVKSKSAAFPQRFVVQGALSGNGTYTGVAGTTAFVTGIEWSIAIQNNPGTGWQGSETKLLFPHQVGGVYEFDIQSNDAGPDQDFNDLILTCSTPVNVNDFVVYGNVTLYSGSCIFNPCRTFPYVIETAAALQAALKNPVLSNWIRQYYPERILGYVNPNPPDPAPYFTPIVLDVTGAAMQSNTSVQYKRIANTEKAKSAKAANATGASMLASNFERISSTAQSADVVTAQSAENISLVKNISGLFRHCITDAGANLTLTFEEYNRTDAEKLGGAYTGTGDRRQLGNTITDMNGNYILFFTFGMIPPFLEDGTDIGPGENANIAVYPDVIVKIVSSSPSRVIYESAPYYNIPNLKRIDICLPESAVQITSLCFNGNLIGSLGDVFLGGNQNTGASFATAALQRYDGATQTYLEANGVISVGGTLAGFNVDCAAWAGRLDIRGCMYDASKSAADNKVIWFTMQIAPQGGPWTYVTENYKQPQYGLPLGNVGPFYPTSGGVFNGTVPAYINIQRQLLVDNVPWVMDQIDRYMQLDTTLYDTIAGVRTPGIYYLRVDGYDASGNHVANATDLIPLYILNEGLNFKLTPFVLTDPTIVNAGCGLFRLTDAQLKTPMTFSFEANDPYGFVDSYELSMGRCPGASLNIDSTPWGNFTITGGYTFPHGSKPANVHDACPGYTGTQEDYSTSDPVDAQIQPSATADGWIETGEYFAVYTLGLTASQRVTNGYNTGVSGPYQTSAQIMMERLNP